MMTTTTTTTTGAYGIQPYADGLRGALRGELHLFTTQGHATMPPAYIAEAQCTASWRKGIEDGLALRAKAHKRAEPARKRRLKLALKGQWNPDTAANIAQAAYDGAVWALANQGDWLAEADRREPERAECGESWACWHAFGHAAMEIIGQRTRDMNRKRKARAEAKNAKWRAVAKRTGEHPMRTEARAIGAKCWRYGTHPPRGPEIDPILMPEAFSEWHCGYAEGRGFPHPKCPVEIKLQWQSSPASKVADARRSA